MPYLQSIGSDVLVVAVDDLPP